MIKLLITLFLGTQLINSPIETVETEKTVYICVSSGAKHYHLNKNCHGLKRCTHELRKVTLSEAKSKFKRTLCGYED